MKEGLVICFMKPCEGSYGGTKKIRTTLPQANWSAVEIRQVSLRNC